MYPGQLHYVRLNTWNTIAVLDLASTRGVETLASSINQLVQRNVPIHMGIVPMFDALDGPCKLSSLERQANFSRADGQGRLLRLRDAR